MYIYVHKYIYIYKYVYIYIYLFIYLYLLFIFIYLFIYFSIYLFIYYIVRRLALPGPPPQWYNLVGVAGVESGLAGWVGCCCGRPGVTERAGILLKPYASHKPYNVGRVPVFINLNLYHPSLNPAMQALSLKQSINRHLNQPTSQTLPKLLSTLSLITLNLKQP